MTLTDKINHTKALRDYYELKKKTKAKEACETRLKDLRTEQLRRELQEIDIDECNEVYG